MRKILVTGGSGQLGHALGKTLGSQAILADRRDFDITDRQKTITAITKAKPLVVIHTAAWTDVDGAEANSEACFATNCDGTRHIAEACRNLGIPMVYISTDYVFDGEKSAPYTEEDEPHPLSVYGRSKLAGEAVVRAALRNEALIVRTAGLYGEGRNFIRTIFSKAQKGEPLQVVSDQFTSTTYAPDLAAILVDLIERGCRGIIHATNRGAAAWFEIAREVLISSNIDTDLSPILLDELIRPARRPHYSVLDLSKLQSIGITPRNWHDALHSYLVDSAIIPTYNKGKK